MDDLNKPLILDKEYSLENNKNSNNLSNDEIQKKSFQLLSEENEETIIKDGDVDTKKLKQIKIKHNLEKDFINAREETLKINDFIQEQEKQLKLLHEEGLEIDQNMRFLTIFTLTGLV